MGGWWTFNSLHAPEAYYSKLEVKLRQDAIIFQKHCFYLYRVLTTSAAGQEWERFFFQSRGLHNVGLLLPNTQASGVMDLVN